MDELSSWVPLIAIRFISNFVISCTLSGLVIGFSVAQDKQTMKAPPIPTSGAQLSKQNCAVCHGNDGKGNGPPPERVVEFGGKPIRIPSPFTESPPDLTTLAQRHKGEFPDAYVADVLRNGVKMPDHGPAEMPGE